MIRIALILTTLFLLGTTSKAQKCLQLERAGSLKKIRYYIGDDITFKLYNDDAGWYTRTITEIDVDGRKLDFFGHRVSIDSISMIQMKRGNGMQIVGGALQVGGANTILFSITYPLFNNASPDWVGVGSGVAIMGIGTMLRWLFKTKRFVIGKNKRLRLLDLNFGPPVIPPGKS